MILDAEETLLGRGFPEEQVKKELYWPKGKEPRGVAGAADARRRPPDDHRDGGRRPEASARHRAGRSGCQSLPGHGATGRPRHLLGAAPVGRVEPRRMVVVVGQEDGSTVG